MSFPAGYFLDVLSPSDPWNSYVQPAAWHDSILNLLRQITHTDAGMALMRSLQRGRRWIRIRPLQEQDCNAHGSPIRQIVGGREYWGEVDFESGVFMPGSDCYKLKHENKSANASSNPDEVLFHELLHAHRGAMRIHHADPVTGGLVHYRNEEEFIAVVLTNIYISDQTHPRNSKLRGNAINHDALEANLSQSLSFFKSSPQVLPLLQRFRDEQPLLFDDLANANARFNPLNAMKHHAHQVNNLAHSKFAQDRDKWVPNQHIAMSRHHQTPNIAQFAHDIAAALARQALQILQR